MTAENAFESILEAFYSYFRSGHEELPGSSNNEDLFASLLHGCILFLFRRIISTF